MALGIISFALVAILGLFPVAMSSARDSRQDTHAAFIVQSALGQIKAQSPTNAFMQIGTNFSGQINLKNPSSLYFVYDETGEAIAASSASQYTNGSTTAGGIYQAEILITPQPAPNATLSKVVLNVGYPANVAATNRKTSMFVTFLRNSQ